VSGRPEHRYPPLLLGAAVVFWGWQSGLLVYAAVMAAALEGARLVRWRLEISDKESNRVADASALGFLLLAAYQFEARSFHGVYAILEYLPFVLFPLTVLQLYSAHGVTRLSALFLGARRAQAHGRTAPGQVDLAWPFMVACLLSASVGVEHDLAYYIVVCALAAWALWWCRPTRHPVWLWGALMVLALGGGFAGQMGLFELRAAIEPLVSQWLQERLWQDRNPFRAQTRIGHIGRLKTSDRIVLRVQAEHSGHVPRLLREATYQTFSRNVWLAGQTHFSPVPSDDPGATWWLHGADERSRRVTVSKYLHDGRGLLAVPSGTFEVGKLVVDGVEQNPLGAVRVQGGPELVEYRARYAPSRTFIAPPDDSDRAVPARYAGLLGRLAAELELADMPAGRALERVAEYFDANFRYTLSPGMRAGYRPLREFLESSRAGHCEYFATAATLLLRAAGIPARYATGYAVREYSPLEGGFVVRRRHAHSWTLAYVDGRWRELDTTPASWNALEAQAAPWWQSGYDFVSWALYRYKRWRLYEDDAGPGHSLAYLTLPLALLLVWRLRKRRRRIAEGTSASGAQARAAPPGLDSDLYAIEAHLAAQGLGRRPGETLGAWLERQAGGGHLAGAAELRERVLPLHYRYRFDPAGLASSERAALRHAVREWLTRYGRAAPEGTLRGRSGHLTSG